MTGMTFSTADFNGDGIVNAVDFNILATNYGRSGTIVPLGTAPVPEPGGWALVDGIAILIGRRKRAARRSHAVRIQLLV